MMSKGYIIDSPKVYIENSNGTIQIVKATSGSVKFDGDSIDINGGWSAYPLAIIDTTKTVEISVTDARFDLDAMQLTTGGTKATGASAFYYFGTPYTIDETTDKIILPHEVIPNTVKISGYTETTEITPTGTQFTVTVSTGQTEILFASTEAGKTVYPAYQIATPDTSETVSVKTTDFPSSALTIVQYPVYSDESLESSIIGYHQIKIFKAKIQPSYGISGSYKTASTFDLTLRGLDPQRTDGKMYEAMFMPVA